MTTDTKTKDEEKSAITFEEIWNNLTVTDQSENQFKFSTCRDRHIVVLGPKKPKNYIIGDIIRHNSYDCYYHQRTNEEQKTITYVMVHDDPSCDICIINLIEIPQIEYFIKRVEKNSEDPLQSPMYEIDQTIDKFATCIDLIILVCEKNDFKLMKNMKKWASDRGHIMALALIVEPNLNAEQREKILSLIHSNKEFIENDLTNFFEKGIYCISDLSYDHFKNLEERTMAQNHVTEWRSKFLRACIGGPNDIKYEIKLYDENQFRRGSFCTLS